jgi:hypothetical protein
MGVVRNMEGEEIRKGKKKKKKSGREGSDRGCHELMMVCRFVMR